MNIPAAPLDWKLTMRMSMTAFFMLLLASFAAGQEKEQWRRVYTLDDGTIEINSSKVMYGERNVARVTFRWTWDKPQRLKEMPEASYKIQLETMEFRCDERRYRIYETKLLDSKGNTLRTIEQDPSAEWSAVKFGGFMEKLFSPACGLIESKRHNPQTVKQEPGRPELKRREPPREP